MPEVTCGLPEECVGSGEKVLVYLGRYLYRDVIQEKDIIGCENGQVSYRWRDSKTRKMATRTVSGAAFLWLLMQHVLPKGFRRARNFGFLHPNCKRLIALLRLLVFKLPVSPCTTPAMAVYRLRGCDDHRAKTNIAAHNQAAVWGPGESSEHVGRATLTRISARRVLWMRSAKSRKNWLVWSPKMRPLGGGSSQ